MPRPLTVTTPRRPDTGSRVRGVTPTAARRLLAVLAAVLVLVALLAGGPPPPIDGQSAATIHVGLAGAVAGGGDYYLAAVEALRAADRVADPFAVRLPTLGFVAAIVPIRLLAALLWMLVFGTVWAWYRRLEPDTHRLLAAALPLVGVLAVLRPDAILVHESWAGLLVALSLAVVRPGRLVEAAALGLAAALIDQAAIVYPIVMVLFAVAKRRRNEVLAWGSAIGVFAIVFAVHAIAVFRAGGHALLGDANAAAGPLAAIRAMAGAWPLDWLPMMATMPLLMLALVGWAVPRGWAAARTGIVLLTFWLFAASRRAADVGEAALLVAPLSLVGLAFVIPALRDLVAAALDRRRITVTRVVR